jgi:56kDa selenium binding protein (SBP56)
MNQRPASFYASPQEAMQAPAEEFLYLACLRGGTGVEKPDFLAVVDAGDGRIVHAAGKRTTPPPEGPRTRQDKTGGRTRQITIRCLLWENAN